MLSQIIWNPDIEAFRIGSFAIRWYSICWCIGLALAYFIVAKLYKQQRIPQEKFDPLFLYCFVGILVGARLGHCLFYEPSYFLSHPLEMILPIRFTPGGWHFTGYAGLASHGGTIGLMIALWLYVRKTKVNILRVLDNIAIATPFTACFIRIGNLMNSEIVGKPTQSVLGFVFVHNHESFPRYPAQLYEALAYFVIGVIGLLVYSNSYRKKGLANNVGTGFYFGFCLTTIFLFRFFIEMLKEVQEPWEQAMEAAIGLNQGQLLSIPFIIIGLYFMLDGKYCRKLAQNDSYKPKE